MPEDIRALVARALADLALERFDDLQEATGLTGPELLAALRELLGPEKEEGRP